VQLLGAVSIVSGFGALPPPAETRYTVPRNESGPAIATPMAVIAYNDLGMHCMNGDFSEIMILPPFNTLKAQVILRKESPDIMTEELTVRYFFPTNTHSADKTNFWRYPQPLLGAPPPNIGLAGNGMSGLMVPSANKGWTAVGIPITQIEDSGLDNPYPLAVVEVRQDNIVVGRTRTVVPVSTEMSCNLCHNTPGVSMATDMLTKHDLNHGTDLVNQKPVLCATCHADNALGMPGQPGVPNLSQAMHHKHAPFVDQLGLPVNCYACHPGLRTQCQRDVHQAHGLDCISCHGGMEAVADPARNPWLDEPRCTQCHTRAGFDFEQPGTLYRESVGHAGIQCAICHGSPHAITPTVTEVDNLQAIGLQGHAGVIDTCTVCHLPGPPGAFFHKAED
jgi:hypothetical protein